VTNRTDDFCGDRGAACAKCSKCFRCGAGNSCEVMPGAPWKLVCASAVVAPAKSDGSPWDARATNAPPDPICQLKLGTTVAISTSTKRDTLAPEWNESITPTTPPLTASRLMSQAMPWSIALSDDDPRGPDDTICEVNPQFSAAAFTTGRVRLNAPQCPSLTISLSCGL
jgi:hypothetical protein